MRRSKNREINVFSVSAIDLFASGMGVFIILYFVLMPLIHKRSQMNQMKSQSELNLTVKLSRLENENRLLKQKLAHSESNDSEDHKKLQSSLDAQKQMQMKIDYLKEKLDKTQNKLSKTILAKSENQLKNIQRETQKGKAPANGQVVHDTLFVEISVRWDNQQSDIDLIVVDPQGNEFSVANKTFAGTPGELISYSSEERFQSNGALDGIYSVYINLKKPSTKSTSAKVFLSSVHRGKRFGPHISSPIKYTGFSAGKKSVFRIKVEDKKAVLLD